MTDEDLSEQEAEWPTWDGGSDDCETCGINFNYAEFYTDDDGYNCRLSLGCYSGESFDTNTWPEVEEWLGRWDHLAGWDRFTAEVRAFAPSTQ